jgi:hypothetical protein
MAEQPIHGTMYMKPAFTYNLENLTLWTIPTNLNVLNFLVSVLYLEWKTVEGGTFSKYFPTICFLL